MGQGLSHPKGLPATPTLGATPTLMNYRATWSLDHDLQQGTYYSLEGSESVNVPTLKGQYGIKGWWNDFFSSFREDV